MSQDNILQTPPPHELMDINQGVVTMTTEEQNISMTKFDIYSLECRMRELIAEAYDPVAKVQITQARKMEENLNYMLKIDVKTTQAISDLNKATHNLSEFKELDQRIEKYVTADEINQRAVLDELNKLKFNDKLLADQLKKNNIKLEKSVVEVKGFTNTRLKMNEIAQSQNQFKEYMERFMMNQFDSMYRKMGEQTQECSDLTKIVNDNNARLDNFMVNLQKMDTRIQQFQMDLEICQDACNELTAQLSDIGRFKKKIKFIDGELSQVRKIQQLQAEDNERYLKQMITKTQCEDMVLKINHDMMHSLLKDLTMDYKQRNYSFQDQMKLDFNKWMLKLTDVQEKDASLDAILKLKHKQYKQNALIQELEIKPIKSKAKVDKYGTKRRNTIDFHTKGFENLEYILEPEKYKVDGILDLYKTKPLELPKFIDDESSEEDIVRGGRKKPKNTTSGPAVNGQSSFKLTQRNKNIVKKTFSPEDMMHWGREEMIRDPLLPEGMQFVNSSSLVDFKDLENFQNKFKRECDYLWQILISNYDQNLNEKTNEQHLEIEKKIEKQKIELQEEIKNVQEVDIVNLDNLCIQRQAKLKTHLESEIYNLSQDIQTQKMHQQQLNKEQNERITANSRNVNNVRSDLQCGMNRIENEQENMTVKIYDTNQEFLKSMDIINSVLELAYLSQIMEYQDEMDREEMSLWGMESEEQALEPVDKEKTFQLDKDCLSCSLEKYRPMISSAFKMACIQYQPKPVCFKDKRYERRSLINLKRQLVEELCTKEIFLSKAFREYCKTYDNEIPEQRFLNRLQLKFEKYAKLAKADPTLFDLNMNELVINQSLKNQIIKNNFGAAYLLEHSGDKQQHQQFMNILNGQSLERVNSKIISTTFNTSNKNSYKNSLKNSIERKSNRIFDPSSGLTLASPKSAMILEDRIATEHNEEIYADEESRQEIAIGQSRNEITTKGTHQNSDVLTKQMSNRRLNQNGIVIIDADIKRAMDTDSDSKNMTYNDFNIWTAQTSPQREQLNLNFVDDFEPSLNIKQSIFKKERMSPQPPKVVKQEIKLPNVNLLSELPDINRNAITQLQNINRLRNLANQSQTHEKTKIFANSIIQHKSSAVLPKTIQSPAQMSPSSSQVIDIHQQARNINHALSTIGYSQKKEILTKLKEKNKQMKKMDNLSILTGSVDRIKKDFHKYDKEIAIAQISALSTKQAKGHGTGYIYSRGLVKQLMSPHSNKQIDQRQLIAKKNKQLYAFQSQQTFEELNEYQSTTAPQESKKSVCTKKIGGKTQAQFNFQSMQQIISPDKINTLEQSETATEDLQSKFKNKLPQTTKNKVMTSESSDISTPYTYNWQTQQFSVAVQPQKIKQIHEDLNNFQKNMKIQQNPSIAILNINSSNISQIGESKKSVSSRNNTLKKLRKPATKQNSDLQHLGDSTVIGKNIKKLDDAQWESVTNLVVKSSKENKGTQNVSLNTVISGSQRSKVDVDMPFLRELQEPETAIYKQVFDIGDSELELEQ